MVRLLIPMCSSHDPQEVGMWYRIAGVVIGNIPSMCYYTGYTCVYQDPWCSSEVGRGERPLPEGSRIMTVAYGA